MPLHWRVDGTLLYVQARGHCAAAKKEEKTPGVEVHACKSSTQEAEAGGPWVGWLFWAVLRFEPGPCTC
jgi:hypothetical protein